ncbi:MAG: hypothetical protein VB140_09345 [Burkholderia sp.]
MRIKVTGSHQIYATTPLLRILFDRHADIHQAFLKLGCSLVC